MASLWGGGRSEEVGDDDGPPDEREEPDTEDIDDESAESGSDREAEVVGDNEEWAVVDEQELIAQARAEADDLGDFQSRDFRLAARIARENGFAMEPEWAVVAPNPAPADGRRRSIRARKLRINK